VADPLPAENDPGQEPNDEGQTPAPGASDDDAGQEPDDGRTYPESYVRKLRRESSGYRNRLAEVESKLQAIEDGEKSESVKLQERLADAETRATKAEERLIRYEVAAERQLDMQAASFITGSTREEIEASADELSKLLKDKAKPPSFDGGAREPAPGEPLPPDRAHNDLLLRSLGRLPTP